MKGKKGLLFAVIFLTACTTPGKRDSELNSEAHKLKRLSQLQTTDHERAARLNLDLGFRYFHQGEIARAKSKFNRAMRLAPDLPEVHYSYAFFLEQVGEADAARKSYLQSMRLAPESGIVRNNYGTFLCRQGQYQEALDLFDRAVKDRSYAKSSEAMENAGLCALKNRDRVLAQSYFERALRHDPNRADALIELAYLSFEQRQIDNAMYYYHQFEQVSRPTARSLQLGIELARRSGDKNKQSSLELLLKAQYPEDRGNHPRS